MVHQFYLNRPLTEEEKAAKKAQSTKKRKTAEKKPEQTLELSELVHQKLRIFVVFPSKNEHKKKLNEVM